MSAGTPAVAQQQRAGVAVGDRLRLGRLPVDLAVLVEPDVAVRVDEARDHPAAGHRLGPGLRLEGDPAVDDVEVAGLAVGEDRSGDAQCCHASGPYPPSVPGQVPSPKPNFGQGRNENGAEDGAARGAQHRCFSLPDQEAGRPPWPPGGLTRAPEPRKPD